MDFGSLDLRKSAEKEYWIHLRRGDTLLYADMGKKEGPCRAKVASISKSGVDDAIKSTMLAARLLAECEAAMVGATSSMKRAELKKRHGEISDEADASVKRFLMLSILDWENLQVDGKAVPFSREQLDDWSDKGGPLHVLGLEIAGDVADAMSPFGKAGSA
jgi:hypothetical protein